MYSQIVLSGGQYCGQTFGNYDGKLKRKVVRSAALGLLAVAAVEKVGLSLSRMPRQLSHRRSRAANAFGWLKKIRNALAAQGDVRITPR